MVRFEKWARAFGFDVDGPEWQVALETLARAHLTRFEGSVSRIMIRVPQINNKRAQFHVECANFAGIRKDAGKYKSDRATPSIPHCHATLFGELNRILGPEILQEHSHSMATAIDEAMATDALAH